MLILTRKESQDILFPNLGITVKVVRVQGKKVRVGVVAPENCRVLRGELPINEFDDELAPPSTSDDRQRSHDLRNELNRFQLSLSLLQAQMQRDDFDGAESTLSKTLGSLAELDRMIDAPSADPVPHHAIASRRALVVEDNPQERELLAEYLRLNGFEVDVAADGESALEYLRHCARPDVVLLDMNMPGLSGVETASAIRSDARLSDLKLFVVSGSKPEPVADPTPGLPYDSWFSKPIRPKEFVDQLKQSLATSCGAA